MERFVSDGETVAIQMWTHFTTLHDADIKVAYNSFTHTNLTGTTKVLGIPH